MKNKFAIIDLASLDYMKDIEGKIKLYDTEEDAILNCGMYELDSAWVVKLIYQHKENK
jgi:hypothetical protein